jgi:hypothetical protein
MTIEAKISSESRKLSDFYYPYYMEARYPGAMKNFTEINHIFWKNKVYYAYRKWFEKAASMFCVREKYDAELLIQGFLLDKFKYPQQLCNEYVWETYLKYLPGLHKKKPIEVEVVEGIVAAVIELKKYGSVKKWMEMPGVKEQIKNRAIRFDPTILAFSDCFFEFICKACPKEYNLFKMRDRVLNLKIADKIIEKIKNFLQEDYYLWKEETLEELGNIIF